MRTVTLCLFFTTALGLSTPAVHAGQGMIGPVVVERVTSIVLGNTDSLNQTPGNLEINIDGGFTLPQGVTCDQHVITTLRGADPDRTMFQALLAAVTTGQRVLLGITDNPLQNAFEGRCSLLYVSLLKKP